MAGETLAVTLLMNAGQYNREAKKAATSTGQVTGQMGALGKTAKLAVAGAATAAVVKFGADSVKAFVGFDDAMNQSIAIMGDVSDTLRGDMETAAREVGKTMRISAEDAAEAYFFLASAGLDAEQSIAAMPQVAAFAQAGMFDMATATDLATDAQSALGLSSDDSAENLENLTRVTDVFVKANTLANTSVQQISEAMTSRAGAAARALGIDVEEVAAVLAAFADQGVKGAEAGTQLDIVMRNLQTAARTNASAFEAAGIAIFDSQGDFRNMADIVGDLEDRLGPMSDEAKKAELAQLGFSDRAQASLITLLGTSDAIREYEVELRGAAGTTQEIADNQLESFQGQLELMQGRLEDVQITIGEALVPTLLELADAVLPLVELAGVFVEGWQDVKGSLGELGDLLLGSPIGFIMSKWNELFGENEEALNDIGFATLDYADRLGILRDAFGDSRDPIQNFGSDAEYAGEAADDAAGGTSDLASALIDTQISAEDAATAIEAVDTAVRRMTDPVFRAADDQFRLNDAIAGFNDLDPDASADDYNKALLDVIEAQIDANQSARDLDDDLAGVEDAFLGAGAQAGIAQDQVEPLFDLLESFDGRLSTWELRVAFSASSDARAAIEAGGGFGSGVINGGNFRAQGGPVSRDTPYIVGERGPEMFIPNETGTIMSNPDTNRLISAMQGLGGSNIHINLQSSGNADVDTQLLSNTYSVMRRMETL